MQTRTSSKNLWDMQQRFVASQQRVTELERSLIDVRAQLVNTEKERCRLSNDLAQMTEEGDHPIPFRLELNSRKGASKRLKFS